ncbi:alpha/beta hydrolase family protein [Anaeromicropila populeti]|uniref:Peptidase S9 prolyl oligopeptidase catalytic domain-containing protein n=1 Tax=Anaeromicropila populeti TaxID=37658 RepID=A0A1I6KBM2_9FIRM|nr:alpha/beta fold hydrolase [Anaeromicropila populeti]SFR88685.1 hypothetical protein SAMN05661086_02353 [Anaeromicropila populeti]
MNTTKKANTEQSVSTTTTANSEIIITELTIKNGENSIYGKLYTPSENGKHPTIILSHGYNGTNSDFTNECEYFAENGYVAYAFDFCGGSNSSKSSGISTDMTIFTEKSDLLAVIDYIRTLEQVNDQQIFLFGGSLGGLVTTLAAEEYIDKVKGMILYYPALCISDDWRKNYPYVESIPNTLNFWELNLGQNFFLSIHDFYVFEQIGLFDKNILIIHGDQDTIVPISYSQKAMELYKNAELITLTGEGHGFTSIGGDKAKKYVLDFLTTHTS